MSSDCIITEESSAQSSPPFNVVRRDINIYLFIYLLRNLTGAQKTRTRKLSYREDDRAMRPFYGRPENFRESLTICPRLLSPKLLMGISSDRFYKCAYTI